MTLDVWRQTVPCPKFGPQAGGLCDQNINSSAMFHADFQCGRNCRHGFGTQDPTETGNHGARL